MNPLAFPSAFEALFFFAGRLFIGCIATGWLLCSCQNPQDDEGHINQLLDQWHKAAATANEKAFFGFMEADATYTGTEDGEQWTKEEFRKWAKPYFAKDKAWDFKTVDRKIWISGLGEVVWFEERLDTWMGRCRGCGLLVMTSDGWKLKRYVLSVAVPNAKIKDFIQLVASDTTQSK